MRLLESNTLSRRMLHIIISAIVAVLVVLLALLGLLICKLIEKGHK